MSVVALYSSKGGVGKTSACVNLAYASALSGRRTLLIDLDAQAASTFYFQLKRSKKQKTKSLFKDAQGAHALIQSTEYLKLDLLPAYASHRNLDTILDDMKRSKKRLAELLNAIGADYDNVFIDCPPSSSVLAENVFFAATVILVPLIPSTLSERTYFQLKEHFEQSAYCRKKIRPFFSMVDSRRRIHNETMALLRAREKRFCFSVIPASVVVESMGEHRRPSLEFAPRHKSSLAFQDLWAEIDSA